MHDILDLHEFFVEGGDQRKSHVLLHISEPSTPEEKKKGYFFALSEINNASVEQIKQLQDIIDDLESRYFTTETEEGGRDLFEQAIEHANRRGHHIIEHAGSDVHCFVGILRGNEIAFSYHGKPQVSLYYQTKEKIEHMSIIDDAEIDNTHLFSQLLQGSVNRGDTLYISTPGADEFFQSDRVQKLITSRTTKETASHIEKVLSAIRNGKSFGGIIFKIISPEEAPRTGKQPKYIAPNQKNGDHDSNEKEEITHKREPKNPNEPGLFGLLLTGLGRALVAGAIIFFRFLKNILFSAWNLFVKLFILTTNKGGQREIVIADIKEALNKRKIALKTLPLLSKILLLLAIASAAAFVGSAIFIKYQKNAAAELERNKNVVQAIKDKKDAADASIIYGYNSKAISLLQEALDMTNSLPKSQKEKTELADSIQKDINSIKQTLQKWITVKSELLADFSQFQSAKPEKLASIGDTILAYGTNDPIFYIYRKNTKKIETKNHDSIPKLLSANTPKEQDKILFSTGGQTIASLDSKTELLTAEDIGFSEATTSISDIFVYNQRLYTLDPKTNQIYKHNKILTGYDKGVAWIKSTGLDLHDAISFAIDGDMFVLTASGKIFKFTSGVIQNFSLVDIDPPLLNPKQIFTYNNVNNLYILESTNKRVVVTDKTGKLIGQYTDPAWTNPTSMIVNEDKKIVYILDQNKLYKFGL